MSGAVVIAPASLDDPEVAALAALHLADMYALTPAESVHAIGLDALRGRIDAGRLLLLAARTPDAGALAGIGALALLGDADGELKSMRVDDRHRGTGAGRALLRALLALARERGLARVWLETGTEPAFAPARGLYLSEGFSVCPPFGSYTEDPLSVFMMRTL